jgi:rod shape-determining protein MreD
VRVAGVLVAVALALATQATFDRVVFGDTAVVDLVLTAVVYVSLTMGPGPGMLTGSLAGLIQDALSSGVIGIGGLAKTVVGFVVGAISQQFIVTAAVPRLVMFVLATVAHAVLFMGLYQVLGARTFASPIAAVATQAVGNTVVGMVAFSIIEGLPGMVERRRLARRPRM